MSIDERRWQDIFQEMVEASDSELGDGEARENIVDELTDMVFLTQQLRALGQREAPGAQESLKRTRERVLQSISSPQATRPVIAPPREPFWQRWRNALVPATSFVPTAFLVALIIVLAFGATIYVSGNARPNSPLFPVRQVSEKVMDLLETNQPGRESETVVVIKFTPTVEPSITTKLSLPDENNDAKPLPLTKLPVAGAPLIGDETPTPTPISTAPSPSITSAPPVIVIVLPTTTPSSLPLVANENGDRNLGISSSVVAGSGVASDASSPTVVAKSLRKTPEIPSSPSIKTVVPTVEQLSTVVASAVHATATTQVEKKKPTPTKKAAQNQKRKPTPKRAKKKPTTVPTKAVVKKRKPTRVPTRAPTKKRRATPVPTKTPAKKNATSTPVKTPTETVVSPATAIAVAPTATREISGPALIAGAPASQAATATATPTSTPATATPETITPKATKRVKTPTPPITTIVAVAATATMERTKSATSTEAPATRAATKTIATTPASTATKSVAMAHAPEATRPAEKTKSTEKKKQPERTAAATRVKKSTPAQGEGATPPTATASPKKNVKTTSGKIRRIRKVKGKVRFVLVGRAWYTFTAKTTVKGKLRVGKSVRVTYLASKGHRYALKIEVKSAKSARKYRTTSGKIRRVYKTRGRVKAVLIGRYRYYVTSKTSISGKLAVGKHAVVKYYIYNRRRYASSITTKAVPATPSSEKSGRATSVPKEKKTPTPKPTAKPQSESTKTPDSKDNNPDATPTPQK